MTPEVAAAVDEVRKTFEGHGVDVEEEAQGGAYVTVGDLSLGAVFTPASSWVGFLVTFQHPRADVYPHFISGDVRRADGGNLPEGMTTGHNWRGKSAIQVSRRSNRWNATTDTAAAKLLKVL